MAGASPSRTVEAPISRGGRGRRHQICKGFSPGTVCPVHVYWTILRDALAGGSGRAWLDISGGRRRLLCLLHVSCLTAPVPVPASQLCSQSRATLPGTSSSLGSYFGCRYD